MHYVVCIYCVKKIIIYLSSFSFELKTISITNIFLFEAIYQNKEFLLDLNFTLGIINENFTSSWRYLQTLLNTTDSHLEKLWKKKKSDNITTGMASQHFHVHFIVIFPEKMKKLQPNNVTFICLPLRSRFLRRT